MTAFGSTPHWPSARRVGARPLTVGGAVACALATAALCAVSPYWALAAAMLGLVAMTAAALAAFRRGSEESVLALALEHIEQGVIVIAPDRRVVVSNARALALLDLPAEMLRRRPLVDDVVEYQRRSGEFGPEGITRAEELRAIIESGRAGEEIRIYERHRPNGVTLEIRSTPLPGGGLVRTYTDVSDARRREAALRAALRDRRVSEAAARQERVVVRARIAIGAPVPAIAER